MHTHGNKMKVSDNEGSREVLVLNGLGADDRDLWELHTPSEELKCS